MSEHEELENSIAAWVLGTTEPNEAARISGHVAGCASCRDAVRRLQQAMDFLALEAGELDPPVRLRQRILAAAAAAITAPEPAQVTRRPPPLARWPEPLGLHEPRQISVYAAALALFVTLAAGVITGEIAGRVTSSPPTQNQVARFSLVGHDSMGGASAKVIELKSDGVVLVDFSGLPALPPGKVYELWLITADKRVDPAGVFVPDSNGAKMVLVGKPLAGYVTMAVTTEVGPDGVQAPTQQPLLYGSVA